MQAFLSLLSVMQCRHGDAVREPFVGSFDMGVMLESIRRLSRCEKVLVKMPLVLKLYGFMYFFCSQGHLFLYIRQPKGNPFQCGVYRRSICC